MLDLRDDALATIGTGGTAEPPETVRLVDVLPVEAANGPDGGGTVRLVGRVDARNVADLRDALHATLADGTGPLVVDVSQLEVGDATGLGVLVGTHRHAGRVGRSLVLRDVPPRLERLLTATRLHRILRVERAGALSR